MSQVSICFLFKGLSIEGKICTSSSGSGFVQLLKKKEFEWNILLRGKEAVGGGSALKYLI